ncbi:MAG: hypothetical protein Sapg2KO_16940 [Saprospiraceae bacterium]
MYKTIFLIFLSLCSQSLLKAQIAKGLELKVDQVFKVYDNSETPGISIGFIKDGQLQFSKSYGMANLEHQIPVSDTTVFSLASVSKQFTALAILLLEEQGKLSLDDDIRKYLPEFKDYGSKITIKMLANHTSGIRGHLSLIGQAGIVPDNVITTTMVHDMIYRQQELNFTPGSKFSYSNSGYVLMAEIVEKVSGQTFAEFMEKEIFQPLGMHDSFVMDDFHRIIKNRARSYQLWSEGYVNAPANYSYYGSTNLYTTLQDLSKWSLNFGQIKVGSKAIFEKMNTLGILNNGETFGYALGQFRTDFNGLTQISHSGGDAGYRAFLGRFPEQQAAVLLLSNNSTVYAERKALEVADLFLKANYPVKTKDITPELATNAFIKIKPEELKQWAGSYLNSENYLVRNISLRNDSLIYTRPEQGNRETVLLALSSSIFQMGADPNMVLKFKEGSLNAIQVLKNGKILESYQAYKSVDYNTVALQQFTGEFYSEELETEYKLQIEGEKLVVQHPKMWDVELSALTMDVFLANTWRFRSLVFERNAKEEVIGFRIFSDRAENVKFVKK